MTENVYEGMFILDSNRYARDPGGISGKIEELVKEAGGSMLVSRLWEERRLAYPIKGHRKGAYWLSYFQVSGDKIAGLNRQCQITDEILRHLVLKVDPRIVDTLVSHATQSSDDTSQTPEAEKPSDKKEKEEVAVAAIGEENLETEDS